MVSTTTEIKCNCCGKVFWSKYYHGGSIEHDNKTNDHNMNVSVSRFREGRGKEFFLNSINLDGNFCNIKDHTYKVGLEIFNCTLKWLKKNNNEDIYKWLKAKEKDIKQEYNKILYKQIDEKQKEIICLKEKLL